MKTYRFLGERTYTEYFMVDIQANSLQEAEQVLEDGDYEEYAHYQDMVGGSEKIELQKEINEEDN